LYRRGTKWWEAGENGIMRSFMTCLLAEYNRNDQVKEDGMDRESSTRVIEEECIQNFGGKARWEDNIKKNGSQKNLV
jgi:hypothetical protein